MWAVKTRETCWLSLEGARVCWGCKDERILFQDRDDALKALRASPWKDKKVLVKVC